MPRVPGKDIIQCAINTVATADLLTPEQRSEFVARLTTIRDSYCLRDIPCRACVASHECARWARDLFGIEAGAKLCTWSDSVQRRW